MHDESHQRLYFVVCPSRAVSLRIGHDDETCMLDQSVAVLDHSCVYKIHQHVIALRRGAARGAPL